MNKCLLTDGQGIATLRFGDRHEQKELKAGEVLIAVKAVALNYRDLLVAKGSYGGQFDLPIIACSDMAGEVLSVAPDVTSFKPVDKVVNHPFRCWPAGRLNSNWIRTMVGGLGVDGVLMERLIYPAEALVKLPEHMSFEEGSTLTIAGLTAWAAIVTHGKTQPGEWVLVHGTGGVSIFAAQIAKMVGARVILSSSSEDKAKAVKQKIQIDSIISYQDEDWPKRVREITGDSGVDVVVDIAGGEILARSIQAANFNARIGLIGVLDDPFTKFKLFDVVRRQITLRGIFMESCAELKALAQACETAKIRPWIDRVFSLDQAINAYQYLESQKHIGKVVISLK